MPISFISEIIKPLEDCFDTRGMSRGEPGFPQKFRWRQKEFTVVEVEEKWKKYGDCRNGSGERYLRKFGYLVRTTDGLVFRIYFQRTVGRGKNPIKSRWWVHSVEERHSART